MPQASSEPAQTAIRPPFVKYSYRSGQVIHYKLIGGDHCLGVSCSTVYATEAKQLIAAFLLL